MSQGSDCRQETGDRRQETGDRRQEEMQVIKKGKFIMKTDS